MITESLREISLKVAMAVLDRRSSAVILHAKTCRGACRGKQSIFLQQDAMISKTGAIYNKAIKGKLSTSEAKTKPPTVEWVVGTPTYYSDAPLRINVNWLGRSANQ